MSIDNICELNVHEDFYDFTVRVCYLSQRVGPLQYACGQFPEKQGLLQAELLLVHSVEYQAQWM